MINHKFKLWVKSEEKFMDPDYSYICGNGQIYKDTDETWYPTLTESDEDIEVVFYIGEEDINKKELYGGDIVKIHVDSPASDHPECGIDMIDVIVWEDALCRFCFKIYSNQIESVDTIERIGNIYENPELFYGPKPETIPQVDALQKANNGFWIIGLEDGSIPITFFEGQKYVYNVSRWSKPASMGNINFEQKQYELDKYRVYAEVKTEEVEIEFCKVLEVFLSGKDIHVYNEAGYLGLLVKTQCRIYVCEDYTYKIKTILKPETKILKERTDDDA